MRDPRKDPRPGDILKRLRILRRVTYRKDYWAGSKNVVRYTDGVKDKHCVLKAWHRWAKTAEVIAVEEVA